VLTWTGVAGNGAGDDEDAGPDGRADPEQHELEDAELPHEALAGGRGGRVGAEGLAAERCGAEAGEEGMASRGGGPVVVGFLHGA
jgi:hypothetical protein